MNLDHRFWNRLLFEGISEASKCAIEEMPKEVCSYGAGDLIRSEGDPINEICVILSGVLKSTEYTVDGKELNSSYFFGSDTIPGGDAFPFYLIYGGEKEYYFNTYCLKKAEVVWLPIEDLFPIIDQDKQFLQNVLIFVSDYSLFSRQLLRCIQYRKVTERLAFWLTRICEGPLVHIPNSQEVLGDMLHVNRTSLNAGLKELEQDGFIRLEGKSIRILDEEGLSELV